MLRIGLPLLCLEDARWGGGWWGVVEWASRV
jgi:hypothetical protein